MKTVTFPLLILAAALTSCTQPSTENIEQQAAQPIQTTPASESSIPADQNVPVEGIVLIPAALDSCNGAVARVKWDLRKQNPTSEVIEIWVGRGGDTKLWMESTSHGEAETGPWSYPGAEFVVKDKASGNELARATMAGMECPPPNQ